MSRPDKGEEREGPVIRDKRRIDPETGEVRAQAASDQSAKADKPDGPDKPKPGKHRAAPAEAKESEPQEAEVSRLRAQLDERTSDLQRLQAEYSNYRKRVERDRVLVREQALANVLSELLPILDDVGRARDHNELTGGFKSVGEALEGAAGKLGLERFGEKGEPFDPTVHEALMHSYSTDVTETTCVDILMPGYRIGGRILRPARVAVAEPDPEPAEPRDADSGEDAPEE